MKCRKTEYLLHSYADKELLANKSAALEQHLAVCPQCAGQFKELLRLKRFLRELPAYTANPFLKTRVSAAIAKIPPVPAWKIIKIWIPIAFSLILVSAIVLHQLHAVLPSIYDETVILEETISEIPNKPENLEKIALNLLIYNSNPNPLEANYALFQN